LFMSKLSACLIAASLPLVCCAAFAQTVLTGQAAFTDYSQQKPGVRHHITVADLPAPNPSEAVNNGPHLVAKPDNAWPIAPPGFKVTLYAGGDFKPTAASSSINNQAPSVPAARSTFREPRLLRTAPNGDIFLSDSHGDKIFVLRGIGPDGKAVTISTFATGLNLPFGIAFYPAGANPKWVYIGNTDSVVRFPYKSGDLVATGAPEKIVPELPGFAQLRGGGHWTRDIVFTKDGQHMLVSVGSGSNVDDADTHPNEFHRADVLEYTPDGKFEKVYAYGIRNCVGEAINPITGSLWCSVNERDDLGNRLVPDYVTSVPEGGFFGWPWYYMGGHRDPRRQDPCASGTGPNPQAPAMTAEQAANCKRVNIASKVITPDVLVQPHMASLEMLFYPNGGSFPGYGGDAFAAEHGSWNRSPRTGYNVIRIPMKNGKATGEYEDFLEGFVTADGQVWGRPVGVAVGKDGSLFVSDDGTRSVWRVAYVGK
jgi:glucose/arabinose dehydrogenase